MRLRKPVELSRAEPKLVLAERGINKGTVRDLLASAVQKYEDAKRKANSGPTRLEAAYDTILFCALAIFAAHGYRVKSLPGHHRIALEGLTAELRLSEPHFDEIVALLEVRNSKYTGFVRVSEADLETSMQVARRVLDETELWFSTRKPELLK